MNKTQEITQDHLGWRSFFMQQLSMEEHENCFPARLFSMNKDQLILRSIEGEHILPLTGKQLLQDPLAVGDWVLIDRNTEKITRPLERFSFFQRLKSQKTMEYQAIAANIDTVFIVTSCNEDFNLSRLERYLTLAQSASVQPVIILTKIDLVDDPYIYLDSLRSLDPTLLVEMVNGLDSQSLKAIEPYVSKGQTIAFMGSSGVGKSTLINLLLGKEVQKTAGIREQDQKGRHTTTARSIHMMDEGGLLLDTPGIRELQLALNEDESIDEVFTDIIELSHQCRFNDCAHDLEPGCAIRQALEDGDLDIRRLESYQKLQRETKYYQETIAQRRDREKNFAKMVKNAMDKKHSKSR